MKYIQVILGCFLIIMCSLNLSAQETMDNQEPFLFPQNASGYQNVLEAKLNVPLPSATPGPEVKKEIPFQVGERLKYSVGWGKVLDAGTATIEVEDIIDYEGHKVYRIVVEAKSNSVFSLFYRVRDTLESLVDVEGLFSRRYWTKQDEAYEKSERKYEFDQEKNIAHYKGKDYYIRYGIQDEVSAVFYVRTLDLQVGQPVYVDIFARGKNWQVKCEVLAIETIDVPAGKFETIIVEPELRFDGVMKKGKVKVWLTNDAHRIPVQVRSKIAIGSILIRLENYRLGTGKKGGE
ncbi:hypothetical protein U27_06163 [Candidatus Vecturithrix granuli]|uniref:DUF3108 domain-containing protein n=1 Tax=Vecturithrix granuli TaxID=1499967 RepID=A0A081C3N1_VECG1|nr:hypothetical protein U27_06163 [Candidatus Vecturithrix granuli]